MTCFHSAEIALSEKYFDFALLLPGGTFCFKIQKQPESSRIGPKMISSHLLIFHSKFTFFSKYLELFQLLQLIHLQSWKNIFHYKKDSFCKNEKSIDVSEIALKIEKGMTCFHSTDLALSEKYCSPGALFASKFKNSLNHL